MEKFIHRENIRLYRRRLAETSDAEKRQILLKLLADEEAKDGIERGNSQTIGSAGKSPDAAYTAPSTRKAHPPFDEGHLLD
jgi:hypothetical protein